MRIWQIAALVAVFGAQTTISNKGAEAHILGHPDIKEALKTTPKTISYKGKWYTKDKRTPFVRAYQPKPAPKIPAAFNNYGHEVVVFGKEGITSDGIPLILVVNLDMKSNCRPLAVGYPADCIELR